VHFVGLFLSSSVLTLQKTHRTFVAKDQSVMTLWSIALFINVLQKFIIRKKFCLSLKKTLHVITLAV